MSTSIALDRVAPIARPWLLPAALVLSCAIHVIALEALGLLWAPISPQGVVAPVELVEDEAARRSMPMQRARVEAPRKHEGRPVRESAMAPTEPRSTEESRSDQPPVESPAPLPSAEATVSGQGVPVQTGPEAAAPGGTASHGAEPPVSAVEKVSPPVVATTTGSQTRITQMARPRGGYQVRPMYPSAARRAGVEGTTLLRVHITTEGTIDEIQISRSAGHAALDEAATVAVRRWRFEAARSGSEPVAVWVLVPIEFRLENEN